MRGKTKQAYDGIEAMLQAVYDWQDKVDALVTTSDDDQDIIATHDSKGRLIELWVRPGLQQELTTEEFEDRINDAIVDNAKRAHEQMQKISNDFRARFASIPDELANNPVAERLANAFTAAAKPKNEGRTA